MTASHTQKKTVLKAHWMQAARLSVDFSGTQLAPWSQHGGLQSWI